VTLIELLIAMTILAIVIAIALPGMQHWLKNARIRTTAEEMLAGIQLARSEAVRGNCTANFVLGVSGAWAVNRGNTCPDGAALVQSRAAVTAVGEVTLTPTPGGATTVTFNALGQRAANADGSAVMTNLLVDLPTTIISAADSRELQINIALNGQIRLCDPAVVNSADSRYCL
jgi:type IV fimbrial biogenesis protein FimT